MARESRLALPVAALLLLTPACAGGNVGIPVGSAADDAAAHRHRKDGKLIVRLKIPKTQDKQKIRIVHEGRPRYISAATQAMTVQINGPTDVPTEVVGLTPTSTGCKSTLASTQCALTIPGLAPCTKPKSNCYTASIATYDAYDASNNTIPQGANELSAAQNVSFTIVSGQDNQILITLGGLPTSLVIIPAASSGISGNASSGLTASKCFTQGSVDLFGVDADGNYILGAGAPTPILSSSDTAQLAVATPAPASPNIFGLKAPTIPSADEVIDLTASVTPAQDSGGSVTSSQVTLTFNSDICGVITEYTLPTAGSNPQGITVGPDGALWFAEQYSNQIGRVTTGGTIAEYSIPTSSSYPVGIAAGADGALWFTECIGNQIGRITTGGAVTNEYPLLTGGAAPVGITNGPDDALWFTEQFGNNIGRVTTGGTVTETAIPTSGSLPLGITAGPDGALWFTEESGNKIGRITTAQTITGEYAVLTGNSAPQYITAGPDGALWFTELCSSKIGRITTGDAVSETALPKSFSGPEAITPALGALWFTERIGNRIGEITTSGAITETTLKGTNIAPYGIVAGPDGALWFTQPNLNAIGRLQ